MRYKKIELGDEALVYIKDRLSCGNTLSRLLLKSHDLNSGSIVTNLPVNVDDEAVKEFKTGGKISSLATSAYGQSRLEPRADTDLYLVNELNTFLTEREERICVFEDASAESNYPFLKSLDTRFATFGNEVYHILCHDDIDDKILETIRVAQSWLFIGIMASTTQGIDLCQKGKELLLNDLELLAKQTERIIVGAYDGEGYLIWSRIEN